MLSEDLGVLRFPLVVRDAVLAANPPSVLLLELLVARAELSLAQMKPRKVAGPPAADDEPVGASAAKPALGCEPFIEEKAVGVGAVSSAKFRPRVSGKEVGEKCFRLRTLQSAESFSN